MGRTYLNYVQEACNKGMTPEEMQFLFNDIFLKANTKRGKQVLRLFCKGIGKAKKNYLEKQAAPTQATIEQPSMQNQYIKQ